MRHATFWIPPSATQCVMPRTYYSICGHGQPWCHFDYETYKYATYVAVCNICRILIYMWHDFSFICGSTLVPPSTRSYYDNTFSTARSVKDQPVPWKMRHETLVGRLNEILNGQSSCPFSNEPFEKRPVMTIQDFVLHSDELFESHLLRNVLYGNISESSMRTCLLS